MTPDQLRALADALEPMARAPRFEDFDVPGFCAWVRACAEAKPVAWTARHTSVTRFALWLFINNALARSERAAQKGSYEPVENVAKYQDDAKTAEEARAMLAAAPAAPQAEPIDPHMIVADDRFPDEQAEPKREPRPCTCHPDDNPPVPCAQKYALNECRATRSGPDEAQIEARDALLDFISENGTASEGVQHYLDRYVRAALAQAEPKREPNPDEVICPACTHQFRAIPENVQKQLWAKREPLSEEQMRAVLIAEARWIAAQAGEKDPDSLPVDEEMLAQVMLAGRAVERAHGIGGSDE